MGNRVATTFQIVRECRKAVEGRVTRVLTSLSSLPTHSFLHTPPQHRNSEVGNVPHASTVYQTTFLNVTFFYFLIKVTIVGSFCRLLFFCRECVIAHRHTCFVSACSLSVVYNQQAKKQLCKFILQIIITGEQREFTVSAINKIN